MLGKKFALRSIGNPLQTPPFPDVAGLFLALLTDADHFRLTLVACLRVLVLGWSLGKCSRSFNPQLNFHIK